MARFSNMYRHSKQVQFCLRTWTPPSSKAQPGAVPTGLSNTVQPTGSMACWMLFSGMVRPVLAKKERMVSRMSSWRTISRPKAAQMVCLVRSS